MSSAFLRARRQLTPPYIYLVLPPISTKNLTPADVDDLTRSTREHMLAAIISLSEPPYNQKASHARRGTPIAMDGGNMKS